MITAAEAKKIATKVFNTQVKEEEARCILFIEKVIVAYAEAGSFEIRLDLSKSCNLKDHDSDNLFEGFPQIFKYIDKMLADLQKDLGYIVLLQRDGGAVGGRINQIHISF
jgi:hypothetical protein